MNITALNQATRCIRVALAGSPTVADNPIDAPNQIFEATGCTLVPM